MRMYLFLVIDGGTGGGGSSFLLNCDVCLESQLAPSLAWRRGIFGKLADRAFRSCMGPWGPVQNGERYNQILLIFC